MKILSESGFLYTGYFMFKIEYSVILHNFMRLKTLHFNRKNAI